MRGLASIPLPALFSSKMLLSNSLPAISQARTLHLPCLNHKIFPHQKIHRPLSHKVLIQGNFSLKHRSPSTAPLNAKNSGSGEEDSRALETVHKFYTAIRNRSTIELSDVIGEECRCISNFFSAFQPFHGKKQVLDFFSTLMRNLGDNVQFEVQPILQDGMNVGVSWKLEWKQTSVSLGKGFSFYMCHVYQGKVVIRNVEIFMEPLLHIEPLRLKLMVFVLSVMDKIDPNRVFKRNVKWAMYLLLTVSFTTVMFFSIKLFLR